MARLVDCATDLTRHDRMLDLTGGDTAALAEITDAQNTILAQATPDLPEMARLAVHRQALTDRNSNIPTDLPAIWARLGHTSRAEQLARAITDPSAQARALAAVAGVLAEAGEHARAEQVARTITDPYTQAQALTAVAGALAEAGEHARAEQVARTITSPSAQARALAAVAAALAQAGVAGRARRLVGAALSIGGWPSLPLAAVATVDLDVVRTIADALKATQAS